VLSNYILGILFLLSIFFIYKSIQKFKALGLIEATTIMSWFYIFYRPLVLEECTEYINIDLYYWNFDYYTYGIVFSAIGLIFFQLGALLCKKRKYISGISVDSIRQCNVTRAKSLFTFLLVLFYILVFFLIAYYGQALLPWNRLSGSASTVLNGFEYIWPIINIVLFLNIFLSLFLFFELKRKKYLVYFLAIIMLALVLGRRGILILPILFFIFFKTSFNINILKEKISSFFNFNSILIFLVFILIIFTGKNLLLLLFFNSQEVDNINSVVPLLCEISSIGGQEYDLLWPLIVKNYIINYGFIDFFYALLGNFIPHEIRLLNYHDFYSITDKTMMSSIPNTYLNSKYGISPNSSQLIFSYLGLFGVFALFFLGVISRNIESHILSKLNFMKIFEAYLLYLIFIYLQGAMDFTLKYLISQIILLAIIAIIYYAYSSLISSLNKIK
jgi:hypothetical protein